MLIKKADEKQELMRYHPYRASFFTRSNNQGALDPPSSLDNNTMTGSKMYIKESVEMGVKAVTHTHRGNNKHQASVGIICDWPIIGTETIHKLPKERIC